MTITVVILTLITAVLMFSASGSSPIKIYWAVTCSGEHNCNLKISGKNFIGEEDGVEPEITIPVDTFVGSGSLTPTDARAIRNVSDVPWYSYRANITSVTLGGEEDELVPASMIGWFYGYSK